MLFEIKTSAIVSFLLSPFVYLVNTWELFYISNNTYVELVLGAIIVDYVMGSLYHFFWKRDFTLKKNITGLMIKIILVLAVAFLYEGLAYFLQDVSSVQSITIGILRLTVFLFPALSALWNVYEMSGKKFPPIGIMNKITQFNKDLKIEDKS